MLAHDGLRAPHLHARRRAAQRQLPALSGDRAPPSAARTTAGASTRTAASRACRRPPRWGAAGDAARCLYRGHVLHAPPRRRAAQPLPLRASTCGWSTWTSCRELDRSLRLFGYDRPRPPPSAAAITWATRPAHRGEPARLPARHGIDLDGGRVHAAHQRPRPRLRLQPAVRVLLPRPGRRRCAASLPRSQHVRRAPLPTCSSPTSAAARRPARTSTCRRSSTVDGHYRMALPGARRAAVRRRSRSFKDGDSGRSSAVADRRAGPTPARASADAGPPPADDRARVRADPPGRG